MKRFLTVLLLACTTHPAAAGDEALRKGLIQSTISRTLLASDMAGSPEIVCAEVAAVIEAMSARMPLPMLQRIGSVRAHLQLLPRKVRFSQMSALAAVPSATSYDDASGLAKLTVWDGSRAALVIEEEVDRTLKLRPRPLLHPRFGVLVHEWAHMVEEYGLTLEQQFRLHTLFTEAQTRGGPFVTAYSAKDHAEFFAEAATAWFGVHDWEAAPGWTGNGEWYRKNQLGLFKLLEEVFGPPRHLDPERRPAL